MGVEGIELNVIISLWFQDLPVASVHAVGIHATKSSVVIEIVASKGELEFLAIPHCVP